MASPPVRVRFAPSPTGSLHVGGARTALFNFLFARRHKGQLILRIEDTDQARNQESALNSLMRALQWLRLDWDEGPLPDGGSKGDFGPYRQSQRLPIYRKMAEKLLAEGKAYRCFLTSKEEAELKKQLPRGKAFVSPYRDKAAPAPAAPKDISAPFTLRFKTLRAKASQAATSSQGAAAERPQSRFEIQDQVRGAISFPADSLSDFVLLRGDGSPVYNFAAAVDDSLMKITHVLRGEEHLPNTLQQILIQKALGLPSPQYGHLSIILDEERKKLSKRAGAENVEHFKEEGFLPEALLNFLSLLGWNPGSEKEIFSLEELLQSFSLERVHSAGAVFDQKKLLWLNSEHLRRLPAKSFWRKVQPFLKEDSALLSDPSWREKAFPLLKSSFKTLKEGAELISSLLQPPALSGESQKILHEEKARLLFQRLIEELSHASKERDPWQIALSLKTALKLSGKEFFKPLRWAFLGKGEGLELKAIFQLLPAKELCSRLQTALQKP